MDLRLSSKTLLVLIGLLQSSMMTGFSLLATEKFGLTSTALSAAVTGLFIVSFASNLAIGWISDAKRSHRFFLAMLGCLTGLCLIAAAGNQTSYFAPFLLVCGVAPSSAMVSLYFGYVALQEISESSIIVDRAIYSASWVAGPAIGAIATELGGFDFLISLLVCLSALSAFFALFLKALAPSKIIQNRSTKTKIVISSTIARRTLIAILLQAPLAIGLITLPLLLRQELQASYAMVGLVFSTCAFLEVLVLFSVARLITKTGNQAILITGVIVGVLYYLLIAVVTTTWAIVALQFLNAVFIAAVMGAGLTWFQSSFRDRPTFATSVFVNCYNVGAAMSGPIVGSITYIFGSQKFGMLFAATLTALAVYLLVLDKKISKFKHNRY
jgi:MFS transporter, SET family, sugar efflux transporter